MMNDYEYSLHLERLILYCTARVVSTQISEPMRVEWDKQRTKLKNIHDVHMQNCIGRAINKGTELKQELERILAIAKEKGL